MKNLVAAIKEKYFASFQLWPVSSARLDKGGAALDLVRHGGHWSPITIQIVLYPVTYSGPALCGPCHWCYFNCFAFQIKV